MSFPHGAVGWSVFDAFPHLFIYKSALRSNYKILKKINFWDVHGIMNTSGLLQSK